MSAPESQPVAPEVDVAALMAEVRDRARRRRVERALAQLHQEQLGLAALDLRERSWINGRPDLRSHRPGLGPLITAAKRGMRAGVRWIYDPMVRDQNSFNRQAAELSGQLAAAVEVLLARTAALERRIEELEARSLPDPGPET